MTSGLMSRQGIPMQANAPNRLGDLAKPSPKNTRDGGRTSQSTLGTGFGTMKSSYGGNIWGNGTFTNPFGSTTRDSSRTREGGSLLNTRSEETGKKGSSALVSTSESDDWSSPWPTRGTHSSSRSTSQVRGAGVSPVRQRSNNGAGSHQQYRDPSVFGSSNLTGAVGQMTARSTLDANTANFKSNRTAGSFSGPFSGNAPPYLDSESRRFGEQSLSSWGDVPALQSPPDDRGSIHNSDYFPGSGLASRDSSLPPSRHGHDATNLSAYGELPPRNHQSKSSFAIPRHVPSLSTQTNGGAYNDRPISQENDLNAHFRRMSLQHPDQSVNVQKPTLNLNGAPAHFSQGSQDLGSRRQSTSDFSQQIPSYNGNSLDHSRSYTPNRTPNVRGVPYRDRQVQNPSMNGDYHHQYPYYSAESTPPRAFGPSAMANGDNRGMANSSMALLQSRLRSLEQEQNFPPNLGPMMAASYQMPYGNSIPYGTPQTLSGVNVNGQFMPMPPIPSMVPLMEPPRGPRDHDIGHGMRSALLDEFKTNQKTKRYELKDIYDHIVEFSGDQHGSRFIQTKLETANSDEKDRVFREIQSNALQLMSDVFGNYVIQKFFEHGDQTQKRTLANKMKGQVFALSTQMYACRVVQKALEHVLTDQQASIVREIENRVMDCLRDQNGNHVIQKAIERVPAEHMQVIVKAFLGRVQELSTHPYGCRVIQRMLEHCEPQVKRSVLEEIQGCEATLIPDQYGNYVTQHAIELGSDEDRARVFELIKSQLLAFSQHKYASNVVEASLKHATNEQRREIMMTLREKDPRGESYLVLMIKDGFGNYVIQRLLDTLEKSDYIAFMDILQPEMVKAKRLASSKQVQAVAKIEHKMHRLESSHTYGLNIPTPPSISTNISTATTPPPPLTGSGQSPQSSSLPSATTSTVDDPVQGTNGGKPTTIQEVGIAP